MHTLTFFTLLASFLVLYDVEALPFRRGVGMISVPIQRVQSRQDLHPQVVRVCHILLVAGL